jgi:hypothetical protein
LPIRVSAGFFVIGLSGNTRIQIFPPRFTWDRGDRRELRAEDGHDREAVGRAPGRGGRPEDLADPGDDDERQRGARDGEPPLEDER